MNLLAFLFLKVLVSKKTSLLFTLELSSILAACVIAGGGWWGVGWLQKGPDRNAGVTL